MNVTSTLSTNQRDFEDLVRRAMPTLQDIAMRIVHDWHIAEDIVQEAFLQAWQQFGGDCPLALREIVVSLCKGYQREQSRCRELSLDHLHELESGVADVTWPPVEQVICELIAEDLLQERLLQARQQFGGDCPLALREIVVSLCKGDQRELLLDLQEGDAAVAWEPIDQAVFQEEEPCAQAVRRLRPRHRSVLELHLLDGLSFREIAAILRLSPRVAQLRFREALKALKKRVEQAQREGRAGGAPLASSIAS